MSIIDLFSKRQKRVNGEVPDVYTYDALPKSLRIQIVHIIKEAVGKSRPGYATAEKLYSFVHKSLCKEYGVFELSSSSSYSESKAIFEFFLAEGSVEKALDVVELCFHIIESWVAQDDMYRRTTSRAVEPAQAIEELNTRFREHGVGYSFESGKIVRVDSQFLHSEAVKPALLLLQERRFSGANEEFLAAHGHYRSGRYKECLVEALKAFESTMKTICSLRGWTTQSTDSAKNLISICIVNGLFPAYFESQFSSIRSLLESGIPTVRNKNGGHGQGEAPVTVPEYLARYTLNLTATTILFLVDAHQATRK